MVRRNDSLKCFAFLEKPESATRFRFDRQTRPFLAGRFCRVAAFAEFFFLHLCMISPQKPKWQPCNLSPKTRWIDPEGSNGNVACNFAASKMSIMVAKTTKLSS